jgi:hypothetical protein
MILRFESQKNFITDEECAELNYWVDKGVSHKWLDVGRSPTTATTKNRLTTRFYKDRFVYPDIVHALSSKVRQFCGVSHYEIIEGHGKDGVVVSCVLPGGDVFAHRDEKTKCGLSALRCNILTRPADKGGILHLDGIPHELEVGELHCYLASDHQHYVSEVIGETSRVLWMFGAYVKKEDWNSRLIKFNNL